MTAKQHDTVVAVSTPPGEGGIGIVRLSGPAATTIADRLFQPRRGGRLSSRPPFHLFLGVVIDPRTEEPIDEALAVRMPPGRSYTGEPMVELQTHGGRAILDGIIGSALACGARIAAPGEFTRRAFLNGRLDLSQAEAVAELIHAESEDARCLALRQMLGETGREIRALRERLLELVSQAEAFLDFSEEEGITVPLDQAMIAALALEMRHLASRGRKDNPRREGIRAVIVGRPNVGKSSLFNMLVDSNRSIVTPTPGTTRDFIEERAFIDGFPVVLIDTAGIHPSQDPVEAEGITRSEAHILSSDIVILLIDGSEPLLPSDHELVARLKGLSPIMVITKIDLPRTCSADTFRAHLPGIDLIELSVRTGEGYEAFRTSLAQRCRKRLGTMRPPLTSPNLRHQEILERASGLLDKVVTGLDSQPFSIDLVATDLRSSLNCLGEITGETATEEILDRIFSRFCIGK